MATDAAYFVVTNNYIYCLKCVQSKLSITCSQVFSHDSLKTEWFLLGFLFPVLIMRPLVGAG